MSLVGGYELHVKDQDGVAGNGSRNSPATIAEIWRDGQLGTLSNGHLEEMFVSKNNNAGKERGKGTKSNQ